MGMLRFPSSLGNHQCKPFALVFPGKEASLSVLADPFLPEQLLQTRISQSSSLFWPGLKRCRVLGRDQSKVLVPLYPGKGCSSVLNPDRASVKLILEDVEGSRG